jgi:hypothetical protein
MGRPLTTLSPIESERLLVRALVLDDAEAFRVMTDEPAITDVKEAAMAAIASGVSGSATMLCSLVPWARTSGARMRSRSVTGLPVSLRGAVLRPRRLRPSSTFSQQPIPSVALSRNAGRKILLQGGCSGKSASSRTAVMVSAQVGRGFCFRRNHEPSRAAKDGSRSSR